MGIPSSRNDRMLLLHICRQERERQSVILNGRCVNMLYFLHKISTLMEVNNAPETSLYHNLANKRHGLVKKHISYLTAKVTISVVKV